MVKNRKRISNNRAGIGLRSQQKAIGLFCGQALSFEVEDKHCTDASGVFRATIDYKHGTRNTLHLLAP